MISEVIVALDTTGEEKALSYVTAIGPDIRWYKVGLELFLNSRGHIVDRLKALDKKVFLDLKFHDIPNTVAEAARWAGTLGVDLFNVHAIGGLDMMRRAHEAAREGALAEGMGEPSLIAVTILTSMDEERLAQVGVRGPMDEAVSRLAALTAQAGLDGVVCASKEVPAIHAAHGKHFLTVCPGIRPEWAAAGDQKRIVTPQEAQALGVSHMVIGRPITKAADPAQAAARILAELQGNMAS